MNGIHFIKSFSKGQVTIPQEVRKSLGIGDDFWLKLTVKEGKFEAEPVATEKDLSGYLEKVLGLKGDWVSSDEYAQIRAEVDKRIEERDADYY